MSKIKLKVGVWTYDRVRALFDGTVKFDGINATVETARIVPEIFEAMVRDRKFDVAELGMSYFLRTLDLDDAPFLALAVYPVRVFRHSAVFVNTTSCIKKPEDLAGKRIGELAMYGHDAGVWPKGILGDDFGLRPEQCRWIVGRIDFPMKPVDFVPLPIRPTSKWRTPRPIKTWVKCWKMAKSMP
jgi:hypothetical protein